MPSSPVPSPVPAGTETARRQITAGLEAGMLVEVEFTWGHVRGVLVAPPALPPASRLLRFGDGPIVRAVSGSTMPNVIAAAVVSSSPATPEGGRVCLPGEAEKR